MLPDLVVEALGNLVVARVGTAGVGRDAEAGRHRNAELRHFRQPDALAAEQLPAAVGGLVEVVYVPGHERRCCHTPEDAHPNHRGHRRFPE